MYVNYTPIKLMGREKLYLGTALHKAKRRQKRLFKVLVI